MRTRAAALLALLPLCGCPSAPPTQEEPVARPTPTPPTAPVEDEEARRLLADADATFRKREYAAALPQYQRAAERAEAAGDRSCQAEALAQVARMFSLTERLEEGRSWLERAAAVASEEEPLGWTRYLGVRGIFERESGERERALATFVVMYDDALASDLPRRAIDAAHHAAIVAPEEEQVAWARKGIAAAEQGGEEGWLAVLWNNLGVTYEKLEAWPDAADAYVKARDYHYRTGGHLQKLAADWALGRASLRAGREERARELLPDARARAEAWREREPDDPEAGEWLGLTSAALGELRAAEGRHGEALVLLRQGRELVVAAGIEQWWPEGLAELDQLVAETEAAGAGER